MKLLKINDEMMINLDRVTSILKQDDGTVKIRLAYGEGEFVTLRGELAERAWNFFVNRAGCSL